MKTVSSILFAGSIAAEAALPKESREVIERYDAANRAWRGTFPQPPELVAANVALDADPLAKAAMSIRILGNEAFFAEREADRLAKSA